MGKSASRREKNVFDSGFHLRFVERLYSGAPRWFKEDWHVHHHRVPGTNGERLDREQDVKDGIALVHHHDTLYDGATPYLVACQNPTCSLRTARAFVPKEIRFDTVVASGEFEKRFFKALGAVAKGEMSEVDDVCAKCGKKMPILPIVPIKNKWIYVLRENGQTLAPYCEIYCDEKQEGSVYFKMQDGKFSDTGKQPYRGEISLPDATAQAWHFFLSPK